MAEIKYTVTLDDNYTAKAKKVAASTDAMGDAMKKTQSVAGKMSSALKSAFSGKYEVKLKDLDTSPVKSKLKFLNKDLEVLTGKPYNLKIEAQTSKIERATKAVTSLGKTMQRPFKGLKNFTLDTKAFYKAKKDANALSKELTKMTGKKHKISLDMENPLKRGFSSFKSRMGNMFSKMNPANWFGRGNTPMMSPTMAGGSPSLMKSIIGGNLISSAISKGIAAASSLGNQVIGAGMNRLENIQSAKARLRGQTNADGSRKFNDSQIKGISDAAMNAVAGTAYGFGDAMSVASSAIAAGVGEDKVEGYLKNIANISAATGSDFNDIGALINKITTTGKLQGDELMQLSDRGLPMLAKIAEIKGVDAQTAREMISKGQISAEDAIAAATAAAGNSAEEMNKTWSAAKMNFGSALSKIGAGLLGGSEAEEGGIFGAMTPMLLKVNDALKGLVPAAKKVGDVLSGFAGGALDKAKAGFSKISEFVEPAMEKFREGFGKASEQISQLLEPLKEKLSTAFDGLKEAFSPVIEAISSLFGDAMGSGMDVFAIMIDVVGQALSFLADAIIMATPIIQSVTEWISANIIPAISEVVSWVSGSLIPAISEVVSTVLGVLIPIFQTVSDFIGTYVVPAFETIANTILSVAEPVFHAIATAVEWATGKFNDLVGAVGAAADALFGLPGKIAGMVGDAVGGAVGKVKGFLGIGKNATGTEYFSGGLTQINERGEEMIQLARGDKIYPAGKTDRIIKNEVKNTRNVDRSVSSPSITINVNGANMTNKDVARVVSDEIKRLGVLV